MRVYFRFKHSFEIICLSIWCTFIFLNGDFCKFIVKGHEKNVCKVKKPLDGFKQALRAWYNKINSYFYQKKFEKSNN